MTWNHKKLREVLLTIVMVAVLFLIIWMYGGRVEKTPLQRQDGMTFEKAEVTEIIGTQEDSTENSVSGMAGNQDVRVKVLSGAHKGDEIEASNMNGYLYGANCKVGTKVILQLSSYEGNVSASVYGYDREIIIYMLIGLFLFVLCLIGGRRGFYSALALAFSFLCLIGLYLPMLYQGWNTYVATIANVCLITVVSLVLIGGYTKKTLCAIIGTVAGVAVSGIIAMLFGKGAHISGLNTEDVEQMIYVSQNSHIQVSDLLYAGVLIAALGAVMDVAMSISSFIGKFVL